MTRNGGGGEPSPGARGVGHRVRFVATSGRRAVDSVHGCLDKVLDCGRGRVAVRWVRVGSAGAGRIRARSRNGRVVRG